MAQLLIDLCSSVLPIPVGYQIDIRPGRQEKERRKKAREEEEEAEGE